MPTDNAGPLKGIRVVELTKVWAGPYVGKQLAFLGAEVIKVESLESLDVTRFFGVDDINNAPGFKAVNTQKLSVQIDTKTEEGVQLLLDLLKSADVFVENLRPGAVDRMGVSYQQVKAVNPEIIYVSMGMYGADGPLASQTGYAPCFAALGGLSAQVGYEGEAPTGMNIRYADSTFGTYTAFAVNVALIHRKRTGQGQYIDVSAVEAMTSMVADSVLSAASEVTEQSQSCAESAIGVQGCNGNRHTDMAPHNCYLTANGDWLVLAIATDSQWQQLLNATELKSLQSKQDYATVAGRKRDETAIDTILEQWLKTKETDYLIALFKSHGLSVVKSASSIDLVSDANLWARGFYREVSNCHGQQRAIVGPSWKMSREAQITTDAPELGEHNRYVLGELLGLSDDLQQKLKDKKIVR